MTDFGWAISILLAVFGAYATVIYRIHTAVGAIDTRVTVLEDKDLEAQVKELTREVSAFRVEIRDTSNRNMEKLFEKIDALRLEIKADLTGKAEK